ncbi:MAG: hypothetical protein ACPLPT_07880 [Moorellales bacterium]
MLSACPGSRSLRTPELKIKACPRCGEEVEVFSTDVQVRCERCGFTIYNDLLSCARWCQYARQCLGEELYARLTAEPEGSDGNA